MKYLSIRKASFSVRGAELEKLYRDRIESDSSYVFGFDIHGYPAFAVLHPSMHEQIVTSNKRKRNGQTRSFLYVLAGLFKTYPAEIIPARNYCS